MHSFFRMSIILLIMLSPLSLVSGDAQPSTVSVPSELYPFLLTSFFTQQHEKICNNTIVRNDLINTMELALKFENISFLAAVEMRRFFHQPKRAYDLASEHPALLIDILSLSPQKKAQFRAPLLTYLETCESSYTPNKFFNIFAENTKTFRFYLSRPTFINPIIRTDKKGNYYVIHTESYSIIQRHGGITNILPHPLQYKYTAMTCKSHPWPLIIRMIDNQVTCLIYDEPGGKLIEVPATESDYAVIEKISASSTLALRSEELPIYSMQVSFPYNMPLTIIPNHWALFIDSRCLKDTFLCSSYDKARSQIYILSLRSSYNAWYPNLEVNTFKLPQWHLSGIQRLILCAINGYKNMRFANHKDCAINAMHVNLFSAVTIRFNQQDYKLNDQDTLDKDSLNAHLTLYELINNITWHHREEPKSLELTRLGELTPDQEIPIPRHISLEIIPE